MKTEELLNELGKRHLGPGQSLLYRAAVRTYEQIGWLSSNIVSLLKKILEGEN